jgi:hypothetical protein
LVAVPQIAGRNIADDKRNHAICRVAATNKKEGLQHSHFIIAKIFYSSSLTTLLQEDLKNGSFKNNRRTWS